MRVLYLDCFSGISGDMTIGALLDMGADPIQLKEELAKLSLSSEYDLEWEKVVKNGISSTKFDVILKEINTDEHKHHHSHRNYTDIVDMINNANLNDRVSSLALDIFREIGLAEAKIHNIQLEKIHFHEVGAIDSIIDIVGTAILLDQLNVDKIISSSVPVGNGRIRIDHGIYPVPAPATLEILKGIPIQTINIKGELTTPTGAGIVKTFVDEFGNFPSMKVETIGYGAGTKTFEEQPNVLRIILGETE